MSKNSVAVILVNYNSLNDTIECLRSLKNSTIAVKVIIVDNASADAAYIEEATTKVFDNAVVILNKENVGFGRANNIGIKWALENTDSGYIFLLNNDTTVEPFTIEKLLEPFNWKQNIDVTTCKIVYYHQPDIVWFGGGDINLKRGKQQVADFKMKASETGANKSRYVSFASGCAMLFIRSVLEDLGGFDERFFMYAEDLELCLRLKKKNYKIWYTANTAIKHKVHGSISGKKNDLPALHPKNPNLDFYVYHMTKNILLTMHEHVNGLQWLRFIFNYGGICAYKNASYLLNGRAKAIISFFKAVKDYQREKKNLARA